MSNLVSIIIPNYKRVAELKRSLKSVVNQIYNNLEIIVVDDNSPNIDKIEKVINEISDDRIQLIKHKINKKGGAARNTGIKLAKGKYIAFLDSDDTWEPEKIEKQISLAEKYNEEIFCYTQSNVLTNNWTKIKPKRGIKKGESIGDYLFVNYQFIPTPSMFVSASLAKKCLFEENLPRHQDFDFLFKIEKHNPKFLFIKEPLTNVFWAQQDKLTDKGWKSESSKDFFNKHKNHLSKKAYANAYFNSVVYYSAIYESRKQSLKYLRELKSSVFLVNKIVLLKYLIRLIIR